MIAAGGLSLAPMATPVAAAVDAMPGEGDGAFAALLAADVAAPAVDAEIARDVAPPVDAARDGVVATPAGMPLPLPSTVAPMPTPTLPAATIADVAVASDGVATELNTEAASRVVRFDASASRDGTSARTEASRGKPAFAATASFAAWARAGLGEQGQTTAPAIGTANAATTNATGTVPATTIANPSSPGAMPITNTTSSATPATFGLDALQAMRGTPGQLTLAETLAQDASASIANDGNAPTISTADARGADAASLLVDARAPAAGGAREATTLVTGTATQPVEVRVNAAGVTTQHVPLSGSAALLHVEAQVHDAKFAQACADRVVWCINEKVQQAEIRLEPPELGPIGVTIDIDGSDVHARFTAAHAQVREALEQTLPKLREMVAQDGLQLASADIGGGQRDARQSGDAPASSRASADGSGDAARNEAGTAIEQRIARHRGLLDEYA